MEKRSNTITIILAAAAVLLSVSGLIAAGCATNVIGKEKGKNTESEQCLECHETEMSGLVGQWRDSSHANEGIGCYECHKADKGDKDAFEHEGFTIATIVSPKDCSKCHQKEYDQFQASHHADAGKILGSLDNVLAEVVEGYTTYTKDGVKEKISPAAVSGCLQCHGGEVKILDNGKLDQSTWPNTGMGRLNPDGSKGSCSACHMRHSFSRAQARAPENCGRCHMGPDHPQLEIYNESKHGISFAANRVELTPKMGSKDWQPGKHYQQGPTCSTCHMGAAEGLEVTHDVGARISWTLRPPISEKIDASAKKQGREVKSWEDRRGDMQTVCLNCHGSQWVNNFYQQFDNLVDLYNKKFGEPATELYKMVRSKGLISSDITFDDKIEFTYFFLWHHEGRRARHGAAMMGPDYTQWHGMYEVAVRFYHEFLPELDEIIEKSKKAGGEKAVAAAEVEKKKDEILESDYHKWFLGKMSEGEKAARKKASEEFRQRYSQ